VGRRTLLLIAAVVIAAIGSTFVFIYAHDANNRALKDQEPQEVLVATKQISAGTSAAAAEAAGSFDTKTVAKSSVVAGALTLSDIEPIKDQVALAPIFPGEQILRQQFGAVQVASSLPIPPKLIAISLQLGDPERVAGFVNPGAKVVIFGTINDETRVILTRAEVIAVGPTTTVARSVTDATGTTNTENLPKTILTLAVSQRSAQKVIFAQANGDLYFGLTTNQSEVSKGSGITLTNVFR